LSVKYKIFLIFLLIISAVFNTALYAAAQNTIFFNGSNITEDISTAEIEGELLIKATDLAELLDADLSWQPSLKLLQMKSDDVRIKLMANNPYIQISNKAIRTKGGLQLIDNQAYLPLAKAIEAFGYLLEYQKNSEELYIFQPQTTISDVSWQESGNQLKIKMDKITPYRILHSDDGKQIIVEIDKAEIDNEFSDNISNNNFYLKVENSPDRALLRLIIKSKNSIPFQIDGGVYEQQDALILSFLPQLKRIFLSESGRLDIEATGEIPKSDVNYLPNSNKMIIDIPSVVIGDYGLDLKDKEIIEDLKVSQFSLDPVILRVEVTLKGSQLLQPLNNYADRTSSRLSFEKGDKTIIRDLAYKAGSISFSSTEHIEPEMFVLSDPPRLVIDFFNAQRGNNIIDKLEADDGLLKSIRTARFNEDTVRFVADMQELTGYSISEQKNGDLYSYQINFKNKFSEVGSRDTKDYQYLDIALSGNSDYEIKKFTHPHRIVIDVKNAFNNLDQLQLPQNSEMIKEVRSSNYVLEGEEVTRLVFELNKYFNHSVEKSEKGRLIEIALAKEESLVNQEENIISDRSLIVIDAGHGGFDPGAVGYSGFEEKEANLKITKKLALILKNRGHKVLLTRNSDRFLSLQQRVQIANNSNASLFISIHANSINNSSIGGVETYYNGNSNQNSRLLAEKVHDKIGRNLGVADRGIKENRFYVIKYTEMPSILVETAFLSHPREEKMLKSSSFQSKAAELIADGITDYLKENGGR